VTTRYQVNNKNQVEAIVRVVLATGHVDMDRFSEAVVDHTLFGCVEEWMHTTEAGQWCKKKCLSTEIIVITDMSTLDYKIRIVADMLAQDYTYFLLKWGEDIVAKELFVDIVMTHSSVKTII